MTLVRKIQESAPPELSGGIPLLGHAIPFARNPLKFLVNAQQKAGDVFTFRLASRRFTACIGPEASDAVFRASDYTMGRRRAYRGMTPVFGTGILFDLPPDKFKEHVSFLHPALAAKSVTGYREAMIDEVENYIAGWPDEGTIDLLEAMSELSIFIATRCMIGPDFRRRVGPHLPRLFEDLKAAGRLSTLVAPHLPLPSFRRRDRARRELIELITAAIHRHRAKSSDDSTDPLIDHLLRSRYSDGRDIPDEVVAALLLAVVIAGEHNTAAVAAWTGALLLRDSERVTRVVDEQLAYNARAVDYRKLTELRRCVTEAERLYPPTTLLLRDADEDFVYGDYLIERGSSVLLSPAATHRLDRVFQDPDRYDPDRFTDWHPGPGASPNPLIAFGGGSHRCTGLNFAYQEIIAIWNVLFRHFELELVDKNLRPDYHAATAVPLRPCRLHYRRRRDRTENTRRAGTIIT